MNLKFLKICIKKKCHLGHNEKVLQSKHLLLSRNLTENKWLNVLQTNDRAILLIVEAEQSVSYRPTALTVTAADGGRRELTSRTLKLRPGVRLQSTSGQSDKSL